MKIFYLQYEYGGFQGEMAVANAVTQSTLIWDNINWIYKIYLLSKERNTVTGRKLKLNCEKLKNLCTVSGSFWRIQKTIKYCNFIQVFGSMQKVPLRLNTLLFNHHPANLSLHPNSKQYGKQWCRNVMYKNPQSWNEITGTSQTFQDYLWWRWCLKRLV